MPTVSMSHASSSKTGSKLCVFRVGSAGSIQKQGWRKQGWWHTTRQPVHAMFFLGAAKAKRCVISPGSARTQIHFLATIGCGQSDVLSAHCTAPHTLQCFGCTQLRPKRCVIKRCVISLGQATQLCGQSAPKQCCWGVLAGLAGPATGAKGMCGRLQCSTL
jgi:hypothetical protein